MIDCRELCFQYPGDSFALEVPKLSISRGEKVALIGPSGSGKTTFMQLVAGILLPGCGELRVDDQAIVSLSKKERQHFRIQTIGMVPQKFDLLDYLTVRENILLPFRVSSRLSLRKENDEYCDKLAERCGISSLLDRLPQKLSQGERQRVALCRGLVTRPKIILADEPTGNLDPENQDRIVSLLLEQAKEIEATVLMITHEPGLLPMFDRVIDILELRRGKEVTSS